MLYGTRLRALSVATAVTLIAGFGLAFFYAPMDADQGFMQKIFYLHVPLAIVALCGFVFGGVMGLQHLRTRDSRYDLKSYVAIHLSLIFGVRLAQAYTHPRVFATADGGLPGNMQLPFYLCLLGVALLYVTMWRYEMTSKHTSSQLRALRRKLAGDDMVAVQGRSAAPSLHTR